MNKRQGYPRKERVEDHPPAAVLLLQKKFAAIWAAFPLYAQNSIAVFQDTFHHVAQQIFPLSQQND